MQPGEDLDVGRLQDVRGRVGIALAAVPRPAEARLVERFERRFEVWGWQRGVGHPMEV